MRIFQTRQTCCRLTGPAALFLVLAAAGGLSVCFGQTVTGYASLDGMGEQYLPGGTTGGAGGAVVTVSSIADLKYYAEHTSPYVIQIAGPIRSAVPGFARVKSNKTFIGLGNDAALLNYGLSLSAVSNIIIKNLTFKDYYLMGDYDGKANDYDCIALRNVHHVWIDHCHLSRAGDGLLDMSYGSGYVTVSWTIFSHHNKTSITGGQTVGTFTYDHCWFHNTTQRNVSAEYADVHAFNCFHLGVRSYCMLARTNTRMLLENLYFRQSDDSYYEEGSPIQANGCVFESVTGRAIASGNSFVAPYSYTLDPAAEVPAIIMADAGPGGFHNKVDGGVILINFMPAGKPDVKGFLSDNGYAYADRGNGYSYGWNVTNTANAIWRETLTYKEESTYSVPVDADFRQNAIIATSNGTRTWEIGLPNGLYQVHLVCGDPGDPREITPANNVYRNNSMNIEGIIGPDPDGALLWDYDAFTVTAHVTDGRLTLSQAPAGNNAAVCYAEIRPALQPVTVGEVTNGLVYRYYEGRWDFLPAFDELIPIHEGLVSGFDISGAPAAENFAMVFDGYVNVPADGLYTFYLSCRDGGKLIIGEVEVVDNDGVHGVQEASGDVLLNAGMHPVCVMMFNQSGSSALEAGWSGPGLSKQPISDSRLYRDGNDVPPTVDAGPDQVTWGLPAVIDLDGTTSADEPYTILWTQVENGASAVTIAPDDADDTGVTITAAGVYAFRLTADTGQMAADDTVRVVVGEDSCDASHLDTQMPYNPGDFNQDCVVDLWDAAEFFESWLQCSDTLTNCANTSAGASLTDMSIPTEA